MTTLNLKATFTTEQVSKAINTTLETVKSTRTLIQTTAVVLLIDCYHTGDLNQINKFVGGLKDLNATNTNSLMEWFQLCGVQFDAESKSFVKRNAQEIEQAFAGTLIKQVNGKDVKIQPNSFKWWEAKVEAPFKPMDLLKMLGQIVKQHEKKVAQLEGMEPELRAEQEALMAVTPEQLAAVQAIIDAGDTPQAANEPVEALTAEDKEAELKSMGL
mgnify:CR=1 FL=1